MEFPRNGWSLFGLLHCLRSQKKTDAARLVEAEFQRAWSHSDVTLQLEWL